MADRDPVLLVSGIAGSILNSKSKKTGSETRVWVRILLADLEFRRKLWSIYNPETGSYFLVFQFESEGFILCTFLLKKIVSLGKNFIFNCRVYRIVG